MSPFLVAHCHQHTLVLPCLTHLPGQLQALFGAVRLQPCPLSTQNMVLMESLSVVCPKKGANLRGFPDKLLCNIAARMREFLHLDSSRVKKATVWPRVTFGSSIPFSLLHPSAFPAILFKLCPSCEPHLRVKQKQQHPNKMFLFPSCVCKPDWFHILLHQPVESHSNVDPWQDKEPLARTAKHSLEGVALVRLLHSLED